jgi:hypothetical protein
MALARSSHRETHTSTGEKVPSCSMKPSAWPAFTLLPGVTMGDLPTFFVFTYLPSTGICKSTNANTGGFKAIMGFYHEA